MVIYFWFPNFSIQLEWICVILTKQKNGLNIVDLLTGYCNKNINHVFLKKNKQ